MSKKIPGGKVSVPGPGSQQCEADGVRNGPDGPGGTEHYWTCTAPGTIDVDGILMCDDHAGELGYGPKQEECGFSPSGGRDEILEAELRDQYRSLGIDEDSITEALRVQGWQP